MDEDDFDFSDSDLDDLPANTLLHLEENAIRATQQPPRPAPESDYGLDDGDEVVNLDDDDAGQAHAYRVAAPQYTQPPEAYDYHASDHDAPYAPQMDVDEPPYRSQADPSQLLSRIKKVRCDCPAPRGSADVRSWSRRRCASARRPRT
jgi:hypothetical protein